MIKQEAGVMVKLDSLYIVKLYGISVDVSPYTLVMEYLAQGNLYQFLNEKRNNIDWQLRYQIAWEVSAGLAYLHQHKIIHRDLKSFNILLNEEYHAKLADFGLAQIKSQSLLTTSHTSTGHFSHTESGTAKQVGTLAWMGPETFLYPPVYSDKSDIYSYAMVMLELAVGRVPWQEVGNQQMVALHVMNGQRPFVDKAKIPLIFYELMVQSWDAKPEQRPTAQIIGETLIQHRDTIILQGNQLRASELPQAKEEDTEDSDDELDNFSLGENSLSTWSATQGNSMNNLSFAERTPQVSNTENLASPSPLFDNYSHVGLFAPHNGKGEMVGNNRNTSPQEYFDVTPSPILAPETDNFSIPSLVSPMRDPTQALPFQFFAAISSPKDVVAEEGHITSRHYWYTSNELQFILQQEIHASTLLRPRFPYEFLCQGDEKCSYTLPCHRYPQQRFYVAIAHVTEVSNENTFLTVNPDVSLGINFLSLTGKKHRDVLYSICDTLLKSESLLTNFSVAQIANEFCQIALSHHHLSPTALFAMETYKQLVRCDNKESAKQLLIATRTAHQQKTIFNEIIPLITTDNAYTSSARIIAPLNKNNQHWCSLELVLFYEVTTKTLQIEIWQHDPFGKGQLSFAHQQFLEQALQHLLAEEWSTLHLKIIHKESEYAARQQDASACGVITVEDIKQLAIGEMPYKNYYTSQEILALRQKHALIYQAGTTGTLTPSSQRSNLSLDG